MTVFHSPREGTLSGDTYSTTAKYVWEGNSYYDPLLFAYEGVAWKHPMYDGLGSTRQLLDNTTQNVTDEYAYEAFGNLMSSTGSTPNPYQYVGSLGYYQTGSSLMHLGARCYLPSVGRFLQRDPLDERTNAYDYAHSNPTLHVDPDGLAPKKPKKPWYDQKGLDACKCLYGGAHKGDVPNWTLLCEECCDQIKKKYNCDPLGITHWHTKCYEGCDEGKYPKPCR